MEAKTNDVVLHINSHIDRNSQSGDTTTNFTVNLPTAIRIGTKSSVKAKVEYLDFPNSAYSFPWHSYKFWYIRNFGTTNNLSSISIDNTRVWTSGTDLASHMTALMTANGHAISFTYSNDTGKLTITNSTGAPISIVSSYRWIQGSALYSQINFECTDRLGFSRDYTSFSINTGTSHTADSLLRLNRSTCYYLCLDIMSSSVRQCITPDPNFTPNIIARISSGNFGSISQLEFSTNLSFNVSGNSGIKTLKFSVLDDELYDFTDNNGMPLLFTLRLIFE